eukprot:TRINITY_DN10970_c0_g1_i1.p1 TRINITY_DN10970_c0_g1~~TRINITY_DN10970_c0_g1_i1.p1  ORF type:complete len:391 (-),score=85.44 TRINITY_DN10970_c0_g1_i1:31-1158(-)
MTDKRLQQIGVDFITRQHEKYTGFNISQTPKNENIIKIIDNMETLKKSLPVISPLPDEYKIYNKQQFKENLNQDVNSSQNYNSSSSKYPSPPTSSTRKRKRTSIDLTNIDSYENDQMPAKKRAKYKHKLNNGNGYVNETNNNNNNDNNDNENDVEEDYGIKINIKLNEVSEAEAIKYLLKEFQNQKEIATRLKHYVEKQKSEGNHSELYLFINSGIDYLRSILYLREITKLKNISTKNLHKYKHQYIDMLKGTSRYFDNCSAIFKSTKTTNNLLLASICKKCQSILLYRSVSMNHKSLESFVKNVERKVVDNDLISKHRATISNLGCFMKCIYSLNESNSLDKNNILDPLPDFTNTNLQSLIKYSSNALKEITSE